MKLKALIFILSFCTSVLSAQTNWSLVPNIERNNYYLLEGNIGGKYPITMYLSFSWDFCGEGDNNRSKARGLNGWYYYDKMKKKIPLIGAMRGDPDHFTKLFVPENLLDTIHGRTCDLDGFKEIFYNDRYYSFDQLSWKQKGQKDSLPVNLNTVHDFSWGTNAAVNFNLNGFDIREFNLTELTGVEYIDNLVVLTSKELDNHFYAILEFGHLTNPWTTGGGTCGAGYEGYLGFMEINNELELERFEFYQTSSCPDYIDDVKYDFYIDFPEKGIIVKK